jgi:hypothetical protein
MGGGSQQALNLARKTANPSLRPFPLYRGEEEEAHMGVRLEGSEAAFLLGSE